MRKLFLSLSLMAMALTATAIPAKRGQWMTLTLADGTEVRAELVGDEHGHYWRTEDGKAYAEVADADYFMPVDAEKVAARAKARRNNLQRSHKAMRKVSIGEQTHYTGQKKGIVILMNFKDTKFKTGNNLAKYKDIMNKENYNVSPFKGSVADYFKAQSKDAEGVSQFELTFDVVGPFTATKNASYYGSNDSNGDDMYPDELVVEAVKAANAEVNFQDYDWDDDGVVDQVFVLYAGKGEADGGYGVSNTIWPHMYYLSATGKQLTLDGVLIDTYACSNEVDSSGSIEGIGCFCHEFSHCMGFPDFYDTSYAGWHGTGSYDLMCSGSYNGNTFQPSGYNAYEKWMSGWLEPKVLTTDVKVENLKPISDGGDAYILYNSGNSNEYYIIENRQKVGWDASLSGRGLSFIHVDFDKTIWEENNPNTKVTQQDVNNALAYGITLHKNDHQRFALVCADNKADDYSEANDLYPYSSNKSLTATSTPKASLFNTNAAGKKYLEKGFTEIKQNSDKTVSFVYGDPSSVPEPGPGPDDPEPGPDDPVYESLFYESFNLCSGTGGNDGKWNMNIASSTIKFDNEGWTIDEGYAFGANQCARFGTAKVSGKTITPTIIITGEADLTFRAGAWDNDYDDTQLTLSVSNGTIEPAAVTMTKGAFNNYKATITATGEVKVTFAVGKGRFFLDEVKILDTTTTAIKTMATGSTNAGRIYTLDGRYVGTDFNSLNHGLYIVNGRKVVK